MDYRKFGNTDLTVSEIGFGAWGIGGPAVVGDVPIGWGVTDDNESIKALRKSFDLGINFYDTADFYGLGHSEELIGKVFGNRDDVIIATKVGHRNINEVIHLDYSKDYILKACDDSLRRLNRDQIDYYQLHSARMEHLNEGGCIEAVEMLKEQGKIRYWGISLNTFNPFDEAEFFIKNNIGNGFQLVYSIVNQRANKIFAQAADNGYGIIARMALHFGLLTGKFGKDARFAENDHRQFRLDPQMLETLIDELEEVWEISRKYTDDKTNFSLSFVMNEANVSTVIPGIKTISQAESNTKPIIKIDKEDIAKIHQIHAETFDELVDKMK